MTGPCLHQPSGSLADMRYLKRMKKTTTSILCLLLCSIGLSNAQGIYFRAGGGYALPMASDVIGTTRLRTQTYEGNSSTYTDKVKNVKASYGAGVNFTIGGGFMFSKYIGVDLAVQYLKGKEYEIVDNYKYTNGDFSGSESYTEKSHAQALFIAPSLIITPGVGSKVPYAKFGMIIGSPKIKGEQHYYYDLDGTTEGTGKSETTKGTAFGFQGAVGMNWMLSNNIDLFTEINFISMTYYPEEWEQTEATSDGDDVLASLSVSQKKIEYVETIDLEAEQDATKPSQELRRETPFSSLSLQIGIRYSLKGHAD
jgi:hypothetical protein